MSYIKEKVAYLRGLAEGMEIGADNNGKLLKAIIETMDEMANSIDENECSIAELDECVDDIYDELDDIDDYLSEDDDDDFDEDDFVELECPSCGETVYFDQTMLESNDKLLCPNCGEVIVPDFDDED